MSQPTERTTAVEGVTDVPATVVAGLLAVVVTGYGVFTPTNVLLFPALGGTLLGGAYFLDGLHRRSHDGEWFVPSRFGFSLAEELLAVATVLSVPGWALLFLFGAEPGLFVAIPTGLTALLACVVCWVQL